MSDWAMPDSICPAATIRRLSTEPCVACVTATRPGTPQLPPCSQGGEPAGFEIALAITPPISKKVPEVAAAPMRKNCSSCAPGDTPPKRRARTKTAAMPGPHHQTPTLADIVSPARHQFRKTTWITLDCNNAPPADGASSWGWVFVGARRIWCAGRGAAPRAGYALGDHGHHCSAITFELAAADPRNLGQCRQRGGAPACDFSQSGIVKDHVGRKLLAPRLFEPPGAQRFPQRLCRG